MPLLILVSLIWASSFGLIKHQLAGLDSAFVAAVRLGLALMVFLPFLRLRGLAPRTALALAGIGAVQFGVMYLAYIESFRHLQAYEVALFTLTTPILVTLFADALDRTFRFRAFLAALVAVAGTAVIVFRTPELRLTLLGLMLVQVSNAAFAVGQVLYRRARIVEADLRDRDVFGLLYAGALLLVLPFTLARVEVTNVTLTASQVWTLVYLGIVASGVGFFLWNRGAKLVSAGTLGVMNNAKIPLAVAVALLFFGEQTNLPRLLIGGGLIAGAVWLSERGQWDRR